MLVKFSEQGRYATKKVLNQGFEVLYWHEHFRTYDPALVQQLSHITVVSNEQVWKIKEKVVQKI